MAKLSTLFEQSCSAWLLHRTTHNYRGRQLVYVLLSKRYGNAILLRHLPKLKVALDAIEMRVKEEASP